MTPKFHIYRLNQEEAAMETMNKDGEEVTAATHWILPTEDFSGLWENLFYEAGVKESVCIHFFFFFFGWQFFL